MYCKKHYIVMWKWQSSNTSSTQCLMSIIEISSVANFGSSSLLWITGTPLPGWRQSRIQQYHHSENLTMLPAETFQHVGLAWPNSERKVTALRLLTISRLTPKLCSNTSNTQHWRKRHRTNPAVSLPAAMHIMHPISTKSPLNTSHPATLCNPYY